jgi:hypothetical protein
VGLLGLLVVAGLLVAADGVDARGERIVAKAAAQHFDEDVCDYGGASYTATPGWFFP